MRRIHTYGALVSLGDGIQGLLHISEFASPEELKEQIKIGEKKKFEIISIEPAERRIALKLAK